MKVVIIGLGSIAKKHIKALKQISISFEFYALRHSKSSKVYDNVYNIYTVDEIKNIQPDFIIISNPTANHLETIETVLSFNSPLFIEKPVFSTTGDNELQLVNKLVSLKIPNYVACNLRFYSGIIEMRRILKDKKIEEVNVYCGSFLPDWRPGINFRDAYSANKEQGGGVHIDLIHELDYLYWLFGKPDNNQSTFKNESSLKIDAIDYANYLLDYGDFCACVTLNYFRRDSKRTFEVLTPEGTYFLDLLKNTISFNNKTIFSSQQSFYDTYVDQMKFFLDQVLKNNSKFNNIEEAYNILKLCI